MRFQLGDVVKFDSTKDEPFYKWGGMEDVKLVVVVIDTIEKILEEDRMRQEQYDHLMSMGYSPEDQLMKLDGPFIPDAYTAVSPDVQLVERAEETTDRLGDKVLVDEELGSIIGTYTKEMFEVPESIDAEIFPEVAMRSAVAEAKGDWFIVRLEDCVRPVPQEAIEQAV